MIRHTITNGFYTPLRYLNPKGINYVMHETCTVMGPLKARGRHGPSAFGLFRADRLADIPRIGLLAFKKILLSVDRVRAVYILFGRVRGVLGRAGA